MFLISCFTAFSSNALLSLFKKMQTFIIQYLTYKKECLYHIYRLRNILIKREPVEPHQLKSQNMTSAIGFICGSLFFPCFPSHYEPLLCLTFLNFHKLIIIICKKV